MATSFTGWGASWLDSWGVLAPGSVDVKVSWLQLDTSATPVDVKVSWLQLDTAATPCDVRVSWLQFNTAANDEVIHTRGFMANMGTFMGMR